MIETLDELHGKITFGLTILAGDARVNNLQGRTDASVNLEDTLRPLLCVLLKAQLKNLNGDDPVHVAIDLGDKDAKVCVQVTTNHGVKAKLDSTLEKFTSMEGREAYEKLIVLFLNFEKKPKLKSEKRDFEVEVWNLMDVISEVKDYKPGGGYDFLHLSGAGNALVIAMLKLLTRMGYYGNHVKDASDTAVVKAKRFRDLVGRITALPPFERTLRPYNGEPNRVVPGRLAKTIRTVASELGHSWDSDNPYWANNDAFRLRQEEIHIRVLELRRELMRGDSMWRTIENDWGWDTYLCFGDPTAPLTEEQDIELECFATKLKQLCDLIYENQYFVKFFRTPSYAVP